MVNESIEETFKKKFVKQKKAIIDAYLKNNNIKEKLTDEQKEELTNQVQACYRNIYKKLILDPMTKIPKSEFFR